MENMEVPGIVLTRHETGSIREFRTTQKQSIQGIRIGKDAWVLLREDGSLEKMVFAKPQKIKGIPFSEVYFSSDGNITGGVLGGPKKIQGVKFKDRYRVEFYPNGKLKRLLGPEEKMADAYYTETRGKPCPWDVLQSNNTFIYRFTDRNYRNNEKRRQKIQGIVLINWDTQFFENGQLAEGMVYQDFEKAHQEFQKIPLKQYSIIRFYPGGGLKAGTLGKHTRIEGTLFAEYGIIQFHENGNLAGGELAKAETIQGHPFEKGDVVSFDNMGRLIPPETKPKQLTEPERAVDSPPIKLTGMALEPLLGAQVIEVASFFGMELVPVALGAGLILLTVGAVKVRNSRKARALAGAEQKRLKAAENVLVLDTLRRRLEDGTIWELHEPGRHFQEYLNHLPNSEAETMNHDAVFTLRFIRENLLEGERLGPDAALEGFIWPALRTLEKILPQMEAEETILSELNRLPLDLEKFYRSIEQVKPSPPPEGDSSLEVTVSSEIEKYRKQWVGIFNDGRRVNNESAGELWVLYQEAQETYLGLSNHPQAQKEFRDGILKMLSQPFLHQVADGSYRPLLYQFADSSYRKEINKEFSKILKEAKTNVSRWGPHEENLQNPAPFANELFLKFLRTRAVDIAIAREGEPPPETRALPAGTPKGEG